MNLFVTDNEFYPLFQGDKFSPKPRDRAWYITLANDYLNDWEQLRDGNHFYLQSRVLTCPAVRCPRPRDGLIAFDYGYNASGTDYDHAGFGLGGAYAHSDRNFQPTYESQVVSPSEMYAMADAFIGVEAGGMFRFFGNAIFPIGLAADGPRR